MRAPSFPIGRDEERRLLLEAYSGTREEGRPRLVTVLGAAGAGQSRLTEELTVDPRMSPKKTVTSLRSAIGGG